MSVVRIQIKRQQESRMRKLKKMMQIDSLSIELEEHFEIKDLSRVKLRLTEGSAGIDNEGVAEKKSYETKSYAEIGKSKDNPQKYHILFTNHRFQFPYHKQPTLTFQTYCEHQYGYTLPELKVLYNGSYYIQNQNFYKHSYCHLFDSNGQKCGLLRFFIKVIDREELPPEEKIIEVKEKPLVRQDLIGQIKINNARLQINSVLFNKKKYSNVQLYLHFSKQSFKGSQQHQYQWKFHQLKLEYIIEGFKDISFKIMHDSKQVLEGNIQCETINKNKRFLTHKLIMTDRHGIKIGILHLDLRYIEKQELLNLIYSPVKLSESKIQTGQRQHAFLTSKNGHSSSEMVMTKLNKITKNSSSLFANSGSPARASSNRYEIKNKFSYSVNRNSDILIPKAQRFAKIRDVNPYISYIDPERSSDFHIKKQKGYDMTLATKYDFTKPYRNLPGVGEYKLPSIWDKY